jgi:hypothetical protein
VNAVKDRLLVSFGGIGQLRVHNNLGTKNE